MTLLQALFLLLGVVAGSTVSSLKATDSDVDGPTKFYDKRNFLLTVSPAIVVNVFEKPEDGGSTKLVDNIPLDGKAAMVKGYMDNTTTLLVDIEWTKAKFKGRTIPLTAIGIKMAFDKGDAYYTLKDLQIVNANVGGQDIKDSVLKVKSKYGYEVTAPHGLSYCCSDTGVFPPTRKSVAASKKYAVGLTFPQMSLQVFDMASPVFGDCWDCGALIPIGVWVGLILSFLFALVVYWGLSMLANIQTSDKWDDAHSTKQITVPQRD